MGVGELSTRMKTWKAVLTVLGSILLVVIILKLIRYQKISGYAVHGIDVSHYQEEVDWHTVKKEFSFVFIKATEGADLKDKYFRKNWQKLDALDMKRGAYHFFLPASDATKQARHFISQVELKSGDLPPVLDVEVIQDVSSQELVKGVKAWLKLVEKKYKVRPVIYTNYAFYKRYLQSHVDQYPIWIAYYGLKTPKTMPGWHFWQYSDEGKIEGVAGEVDLNVFYGSLDELERICLP
jgi:lysozyme